MVWGTLEGGQHAIGGTLVDDHVMWGILWSAWYVVMMLGMQQDLKNPYLGAFWMFLV